MMRRALGSLFVLAMALLNGCYETPFLIGSEADAKVDAALLGDWSFDAIGDGGDGRAKLNVADLDGHRYSIGWTTYPDNSLIRMTGYVTEVAGAKFLIATPFGPDGKPDNKHWVIRFDRDGDDGLAVSQLEPEFFKDKKVDSNEALRATVESNVNEPAMYVADVLVGKRVKK